MAPQTRSGPRAALLGMWQRNHELLRNAGSLFVTTGLSSIFGFVYWIIAARMFSRHAVGYGSATVSAMTLLGTIGMFGLGTMLIGELPQRRDGGGLVSATLVFSGVGSLVLGLAFPPVAAAFGANFPGISGTPVRLVLFAVGVAATAVTMVLDEGMIGLLRGGVVLSRNLAMSVIKLIALPVAAVVLHDAFGVGLELAWVTGTLASLLPAGIVLKRDGLRLMHRPDWGLLRGLGRVALAHNWLNLAIQTPPRLIPVLVTLVVSPDANASFYVAYMLVNFLFMVPACLSTVLFAIASAAPEVVAEKLRFVLRLSLMIGLPAMAVLALGGHFALGLFGPGYQSATIPLLLLVITYIPGIPKAQYIAVCRANGQVTRAAVLLTIAAGCELGAVMVGGKLGGLNWLTFGYLLVTILEGIVTAPTVLRAAYARGPQRGAAASGLAALTATDDTVSQLPADSSYLHHQQRGLAALIGLASGAVSEGHSLDAAVEVWRTGSFPAFADGPRGPASATATRADRFGGESLMSLQGQPEYRGQHRRQQAGLDALVALATPASSDVRPKDVRPKEVS